MTTKDATQIVGKTYNLPVTCMLPKDGVMCMLVAFEDKRIPVPMFYSQLNPLPTNILCKVVSINELGFPVLEQITKGELAYLPGFKKPVQKPKEGQQPTPKEKQTSQKKTNEIASVKKTEVPPANGNKEKVNTSIETAASKSVYSPSKDNEDFIKWRENQKRQLDIQRELLVNDSKKRLHAKIEQKQLAGSKTGSINGDEFKQVSAKEIIKSKKVNPVYFDCDAHFFEEFDVKNKLVGDFVYKDKSVSFPKFIQTTGSIVLRYKLLIATADLIYSYHKSNRIIGDLDIDNIKILSNETFSLKMLDKTKVSYKTNMIHLQDGAHFLSPEVQHHLSPITPMSECYSFALVVFQMLSGHEFSFDLDFSTIPYITENVWNLLGRSLLKDPMSRQKMEEWCKTLRFGLDELVFCTQCKQWYAPRQQCACPICKKKSKVCISLQIGAFGNFDVYNVEKNIVETKPTMIGNSKGNIIITESTSKILYGYEFGLHVQPDLPIAVVTLISCNSNKDVTLHIIPMSHTSFTLLDKNYLIKENAFDEPKNIEIAGDELYETMFLVESNLIQNKLLKICHI